MTRPRLLDAFSGAGGAARGYQMAGFHVTGVDHVSQPRYAGDVFIQADALEYIAEHGRGYDAIHASPPCQRWSAAGNDRDRSTEPDLIAPTRRLLIASGLPWVMENVMPAPLQHGITLCGAPFGLRTYRHRRFETSWLLFQPEHPKHTIRSSTYKRRKQLADGLFISVTGDVGSSVGPLTMGIDWMTGEELSQAIPPAYTTFIGERLMSTLKAAA